MRGAGAEDYVPFLVGAGCAGVREGIDAQDSRCRRGQAEVFIAEDPQEHRIFFRIGHVKNEVRREEHPGIASASRISSIGRGAVVIKIGVNGPRSRLPLRAIGATATQAKSADQNRAPAAGMVSIGRENSDVCDFWRLIDIVHMIVPRHGEPSELW